ncbi:ATP-binding protein [Dysgonomonas sp. 216]|uniref:AAA family ATPase n=1 Tax=Dysgonomonas sp. 216 TaxID=2302934 RepID=UPI0013D71458|nr:AAA family ATPase [Dysgonomonas sp. 216]NDW19400.1 ATP-binding protein [Dysgonomonas sp. 216]
METSTPILFILSGLPASGKSSLAKLIAQKYNAVYLRIDTIEQALRDLCSYNVQSEGYRLAYRIASNNLDLGHNVVADSCNPIDITRREWEDVATQSNSRYINIEVICSDKKDHKRRAENRCTEVKGLKLPTWNEIQSREYHAWVTDRILIDTAGKSTEESFYELIKEIRDAIKE